MQCSPSIVVEVRDDFSPDLELLRREYADLDWPGGTSADEFDRHSLHLVVTVDGDPAGMVRMTHQPPSVLSEWAVGKHFLPIGDHIVEANRGVVARRWRGMDFYKILMAEVTRYCQHQAVSQVVGAIEPDFPLRGYLESIGFSSLGAPTLFRNPPKSETKCQVIVQEPALAFGAASAALETYVGKACARGYSFHSTVLENAVFGARTSA